MSLILGILIATRGSTQRLGCLPNKKTLIDSTTPGVFNDASSHSSVGLLFSLVLDTVDMSVSTARSLESFSFGFELWITFSSARVLGESEEKGIGQLFVLSIFLIFLLPWKTLIKRWFFGDFSIKNFFKSSQRLSFTLEEQSLRRRALKSYC